jgi:hypothetical protein
MFTLEGPHIVMNRTDAQNGLDFHFNITSLISNIPHLTNSDIDLNMPFDHNFNYYSIDDFHRTMILLSV